MVDFFGFVLFIEHFEIFLLEKKYTLINKEIFNISIILVCFIQIVSNLAHLIETGKIFTYTDHDEIDHFSLSKCAIIIGIRKKQNFLSGYH